MSADVFAEGEPNRTEPHWFVVNAEPCPYCGAIDCRPGPGTRCCPDCSRHPLDVSSAIPVERRYPPGFDFRGPDGRNTVFVPVSSTEAET